MKSKVAVIPCDSYEEEQVYQAVRKGVQLLGGMDAFVGHEEKLLLKPNLLSKASIEKAVTTHPSVFSAVTKLLREEGYNNLVYGDSPGAGNAEKTAEACGIKAAADHYHVPMADFTRSKPVEFTRSNVPRHYEIAQGVLDSDAIINICKMKTHQLERITGGVKNLFGCVYGVNKGATHVKYPDAASFAQMLVDLNLLLKAKLHIMDGIVAMEGNGPASGDPVKMNVLILSADPVAMDATFCRLVDLDPKTIPTCFYGEIYGLGHWKEDDIELVGIDNLSDYVNKKFNVSREKVFSGRWSFLDKLKVLNKKPVIIKERCIRCGACVKACPVEEKAVDFPIDKQGEQLREKDGRLGIPRYNYKKCIKCYCCQEMCPEKAIIAKRKLI